MTPKPNPRNPLMIDIPQQLETERLLLCAPAAGFGLIVQAAIRETHDKLKTWFGWAQTVPTLDETEEEIRKAVIRFHGRERMRFYLFRKTDGAFVGEIELTPLDWQIASFALSFWVSKSYEGQGFMTEAVNGLVSFAFSKCQAHRLEIRCDSRHHRLIGVAERAGFIYEGVRLRDRRDDNGNLRDTVVYVKFSS
jgi:RimJ/RimL family protein N-acetyltransferase